MIVLVDDDPELLHYVESILRKESYDVVSATNGREALAACEALAPALVISDMVMPEMGGLELRQAYALRFPERTTPFVFLSSLGDPETVAEGLDAGADDYLVKPVARGVLLAKVRAVLRRMARQSVAAFTGSLSKISFANILRFCELKGMTGEVSIVAGAVRARLEFRAGQLTCSGDDDLLEQLWDLKDGEFVIASQSVDFGDIADAALPPAPAPPPEPTRPMGCLSGVRVGDRLFQVQTEAVARPSPCIVTIVTLDGKTMLKRTQDMEGGLERGAVERRMRAQHQAVEAEIESRLGDAARHKAAAAESTRERFNRLFDQGFDRYRERDYAGALTLWSEAEALDPEHATLQLNMRILRQKLEEAARTGGS
ncbi:MAG: response regulator [Polyangiaceae bacterium]|nr:response regulator [Polyangiaceae bacterium]